MKYIFLMLMVGVMVNACSGDRSASEEAQQRILKHQAECRDVAEDSTNKAIGEANGYVGDCYKLGDCIGVDSKVVAQLNSSNYPTIHSDGTYGYTQSNTWFDYYCEYGHDRVRLPDSTVALKGCEAKKCGKHCITASDIPAISTSWGVLPVKGKGK